MIVLDTHAWLWLADDSGKLSRAAVKAIESEAQLGVAAISCWELAMLVAKKRLELDQDVLGWIRAALDLPKVELLPLLPDIAVASTRLDRTVHDDPADRMIVATALHHGARLVTADKLIRGYKGVETIW